MRQQLLRDKLLPPALNHPLVPRPRLIEQLEASGTQVLRVIHAPAGYGKTSLLVEWQRALAAKGARTAWLRLDPDDNRPTTLTKHLCAAVEMTGISIEATRSLTGVSMQDTVPKTAASLLINEIAESGIELHLLIDDFEAIDNEEIQALLRHLIIHAPPNLHISLAGRANPALGLSELAAKDQLVTLKASDLRLNLKEASALLEGASVSLSERDVEMLLERTEGWPIALKLAGLWILEDPSSKSQIASFSGKVAMLADYLTEQVYQSQSPEIQDFLLCTSILTRMNGEVANRLCGRGDAWQLLEALENQDLLINSIDHEREWYRYHQLFRNYLYTRLKRRDPERLIRLHDLAADWYLRSGELSEALRHAHIAGDTSAVAARLEALGGWLLRLTDQFPLMELANEKLAASDVDAHLHLQLNRIYILLKQGGISEARQRFERLRDDSRDFALWNDQPIDAVAKSELDLMSFLIAGYEDRPFTLQDLQKLEVTASSMPDDQPLLGAVAHNILCLFYIQAGRLDDCVAAGNLAIAGYRKAHSAYMESFIFFHQGKSLLMQGRLRDTEMVYAENDRLVKKHFAAESDFSFIESVYRAELLYLQNKIDQAAEVIHAPLSRIGKFDAWFDVYHTTFTIAAATARAREGVSAAARFLREADDFAISRQMPRLGQLVLTQRLNNLVWAASEDAPAAYAKSKLIELCKEYQPFDISKRRIYVASRLAFVRLYLHLKSAREAESQLARLDNDLDAWRSDYGALERRLLRAMVEFQLGNESAAISILDRAVSSALYDNYQRPFVDEGHLIKPLLDCYAEHIQSKGSNRLRDIFLRKIRHSIEAEQRLLRKTGGILTPRQLEVLAHLREGFSNKEIARRMAIDANTVKFHLKNVFRHLDVNSRSDALIAARQRGLMS